MVGGVKEKAGHLAPPPVHSLRDWPVFNVVGMNASDLVHGNDNHVGLGRSQKSFRVLLPFDIDLIVAGP